MTPICLNIHKMKNLLLFPVPPNSDQINIEIKVEAETEDETETETSDPKQNIIRVGINYYAHFVVNCDKCSPIQMTKKRVQESEV